LAARPGPDQIFFGPARPGPLDPRPGPGQPGKPGKKFFSMKNGKIKIFF
jgi:hypothetical protein